MLALYNRSSKVTPPRNNDKNRLLSPSLPSTRFLHAMSESQTAPSLFPMGGNARRRHPNRQVARHCRNDAPLHRKRRTRPLMRACSSFGYELFGHLGELRDRPGGPTPYPSGFPPVGSRVSAGASSGSVRESEYTMFSGRKGFSSSESPSGALSAFSTGRCRIARRLSS